MLLNLVVMVLIMVLICCDMQLMSRVGWGTMGNGGEVD